MEVIATTEIVQVSLHNVDLTGREAERLMEFLQSIDLSKMPNLIELKEKLEEELL